MNAPRTGNRKAKVAKQMKQIEDASGVEKRKKDVVKEPQKSQGNVPAPTRISVTPEVLRMTPDKVLQGVIYSEILGRPKAKKRRW